MMEPIIGPKAEWGKRINYEWQKKQEGQEKNKKGKAEERRGKRRN